MNFETLQGRKVEIADASTLSPRDLHLKICKNRDFEVSFVWQRAIFLTAFLLGCFTVYGSVTSMLLKESPNFGEMNAICFFTTIIGILVSMVWIMMAKGSKAWYEIYEKAAEAFVAIHQTSLCSAIDAPAAQNKWREVISEAAGVDSSIKEPDESKWLFSVKGGAYSVSRINIFIGQASFVIWLLLSLGHIGIAFGKKSLIVSILGNRWCMVAILVGIVVGMCVYGSRTLKSGYLDKKKQ